jgi:small subunit ribosomal protein S20
MPICQGAAVAARGGILANVPGTQETLGTRARSIFVAPTYPRRLTFVGGWAIMSPAFKQDNERGKKILANTSSAIKRVRSSERKRKINQVHRSRARTFIKKTRHLIETGQLEEAEIAVQQAISALDRAAQKGVIHQNNAARRKARLIKSLNQAKQQAA